MALADVATFRSLLTNPMQRVCFAKPSATSTVGGRMGSWWLAAQLAGAIPSTPVVPAQNIAGALGQRDGAGTLRILGVELSMQFISSNSGSIGLVAVADRLSHQGGLTANTAFGSTQTTNLPTAALTRYTDGVGVMACIEIYVALGASPANLTASYTNEAGVAGRTSESLVVGPSPSGNSVQCMFPLNLQSGDRGVRSVESITLDAATGVAGNFGVTLFKPLLFIAVPRSAHTTLDGLIGLGGQLQQVQNGACLFMFSMQTNIGQLSYGTFFFGED